MKQKINHFLLKYIFASVCLGQLVRFSLLNYPVYPHYFLLPIFILLNPALSLPTLIFTITLLIHPSPYTLRLVTLLLFAESIKKSPPCQKLLPLTLKLVLAFGLLQVIFFSDLRFLYQFGWDDHYFRLTFPLFDPNLTGIILIFAHLYFNKLSSLLAIILTFSRSTYLTLLSLKPKFISLVILLFGLSFFISTKFGEGLNLFRTYSITKRLETFQNFEISFLGDGQYHRFPNTYTNILATSGLLGFIALIYYLIINLKNTPKKSLARSATFALLIHSLFNPSFFHPSIFLIFSLIQSRASPTSPSNSE